MAYLSHEQIAVGTAVLDQAAFTIPARATWVELQASGQIVNYTMDNGATPPTVGATGVGMRLLTTENPKFFLIEDLLRIQMIRGAGSDATINVHYGAGRDV